MTGFLMGSDFVRRTPPNPDDRSTQALWKTQEGSPGQPEVPEINRKTAILV